MAELTTELDDILGADDVARLTELDDAQLADLAGRLRDLEVRVSSERKGLFDRIDTLQAELVARHKSGLASVDGLLS
jgi:predicted transcriptional regulator of viral defense system